jgi:hypothetical protein
MFTVTLGANYQMASDKGLELGFLIRVDGAWSGKIYIDDVNIR